MKKQYLVLGLGSFGQSMAVTLEELGCDVIAIDKNMECVQQIADQVSYSMCADVLAPGVLNSVGAKNVDGALICISDSLESSIMATLAAKEMKIPYIMAKVKSETQELVLKKLGVSETVYPERESGKKLAKTLMEVDFAGWVELSDDYSIVERLVPENWVGQSMAELEIRKKYHINIIGIITDGKMSAEIDPTIPLQEDQTLVLLGGNDQLRQIKDL